MYVRPEIAAMAGYTPGEQPQGVSKFIKLNTNENPYPPPAGIRRAIEEVLDRGLQKYPDPMASAFRTRAAELLGLPGKDWILAGNGSDDVLTICTRAFVGQGELLRLPYPSYILYRTLAQLQGARWEEVRFNADWSLPAAFGDSADGLKLVFLPNPNSPTGTMISREAVLKFAERLLCPLLVDEAYVDFADWNCVDLVRQNEKILVSRSLSKSYGLAGLRFGYLIGQPQIIEQLVKVKDSYNCDALSIAAATAAINDTAWLAENRRRIIATRSRLTTGLQQLGFEVIPSQANFVWCTHARHAAKALYEQLKAAHVLVRFMSYPGWSDGLRISVGSDEQIDALLATLASIQNPKSKIQN
ncbi:MAG TPA: histidinol-phosphate transaminase [Pirellulaceae bacterium]|nr:histidinol-phosphate transaminase [Pirellulaceae bacterium]